jgi:hypothetical protein
LDSGAIGGAAHEATQGIDLADDGTLRDSSDSGIAGHLTDGIQDGCEQEGPGSEARGHGGGLSAGVATTDNYDVVVERHRVKLLNEDMQRLDAEADA